MKTFITLVIGVLAMITTCAGEIYAGTIDIAMQMIAQHEDFKSSVYTCPGGVPSIGYGFTDKNLVAKGTITRREADVVLRKKTMDCLAIVHKYCSTVVLTQKQEAALCDFIYNLGETKFRNSTLLKLIRRKAPNREIVAEIKKWHFAGQKSLEGLVKRRAAEAAYWVS